MIKIIEKKMYAVQVSKSRISAFLAISKGMRKKFFKKHFEVNKDNMRKSQVP